MPQDSAVARKDEWMDKLQATWDQPGYQKLFLDMLGPDNVDRFKAVAIHSIVSNSELRNADPLSVIEAVRSSAALGLEPTGLLGEAAIVVYGRTAKLMPMWQGYLKIARNSREIAAIDTQVVYEKDLFEIDLGTNSRVDHRPYLVEGKSDTRGDYRGAYAWARLTNGQLIVEWMNVADIEEARKFAAPNSKAWGQFWGEMARKTVLKRLQKRLPRSAQLVRLLEVDAEIDASERPEQRPAVHVSPARNAAVAALPEHLRPEPVEDPDIVSTGSVANPEDDSLEDLAARVGP